MGTVIFFSPDPHHLIFDINVQKSTPSFSLTRFFSLLCLLDWFICNPPSALIEFGNRRFYYRYFT